MHRLIEQRQVPESMLGELPWGWPLKLWQLSMLQRALEDGHVDDSPCLAAAIRDELRTR